MNLKLESSLSFLVDETLLNVLAVQHVHDASDFSCSVTDFPDHIR